MVQLHWPNYKLIKISNLNLNVFLGQFKKTIGWLWTSRDNLRFTLLLNSLKHSSSD